MHTYIIEADDITALNLKIEEIKSKIPDCDFSTYDMDEDDIYEVIDELKTVSMFDNTKVVLARNGEGLFSATGDKAFELQKTLVDTSTENVLIVAITRDYIGNELFNKIKRFSTNINLQIKNIPLDEFADREFKQDNFNVLPETINLLVQYSPDMSSLRCNIDMLKCYKWEHKSITEEDVTFMIRRPLDDNVYDFLKKYERKQGAVKIYWKMFGSSGKISRDDGKTVVESFVVSWPKPYNVGKCFYNTSYGFNDKSTHNGNLHHLLWASYKGKDFPPVDVWGKTCVGETYYIPNKPLPIQINHYFTKSLQEYSDKKNKGDVYFEINPHDDEYFYSHEKMCTSVDYSAYKYLIELKKRLNSKT